MPEPLPAPLPAPRPVPPSLPFAEPPGYQPPIPQPNVPKPVNILPPKPVGRPISVPFGYPLPEPRAVPVPRPLAQPLRPLPAAPGAGIVGALSKPLGIIGGILTAIQLYQFGCDSGLLPGAVCPFNKPEPKPVPAMPGTPGGLEPGVQYKVKFYGYFWQKPATGPAIPPEVREVVVTGPVLGIERYDTPDVQRYYLVSQGGAQRDTLVGAGHTYDPAYDFVIAASIVSIERLDGQPDPTAQPGTQPTTQPTPANPVPVPAPQPAPQAQPSPLPQPQPTPQPQPVPQPSPFPSPQPGQQPSPVLSNNPSGNPTPIQDPGSPQPAPNPAPDPTPAPQPVFPPIPVPLPAPQPVPLPVPIPEPVPQPEPDPRERMIPPPVPLPPPSDCSPCAATTQQATARLERDIFELKQQVSQILATLMMVQAAQQGHIQLDQAGHATNAALGTANLTNTTTTIERLGNQIANGGIAGLMIRTFTFLQIDRVLNVLTYMATLHNALQLSNSIKDTLFSAVTNILAVFGLKDEKGDPLDAAEIVSMWLLGFANTLFGAENVTAFNTQWKKWNRVYQAGANILSSLQSIQSSMFEALETIGSWIALIGNALKASGAVSERLYKWLTPNPNFRQNKWMAFLDRTEEFVSQIENVSSEVLNITETVGELTQQKQDFDKAIAEATEKPQIENMPKASQEEASKVSSQSPDVPVLALDNPTGF